MRGCAVLLVLLFHFLEADPNRGLRAIPFKIGAAGWSGVDLFFVLSGYLITSILLRTKSSPRYFRDFYSRRVRRIFPLYYGVLLAVFVVLPLIDRLRTPGVVRLLHDQWYFWLYISNFDPRSGHADWLELGHFWSLAIEEQFYLVWPAIVYRTDRRRAMFVALGGLLLSIALRSGLQIWALRDPSMSIARHWAFAWTPCRLDALAVGALIALLSTDAEWRRKLDVVGRGVAVIGLPVYAWFIWRGTFTDALGGGRVVLATFVYTLLALVYGSIIVEATRSDSGWPQQLMSIRPLRFLGKYSYGIYVYQGLLWPALVALLRTRLGTGDAAVYAYFFISLVPILMISMISWHAYERRFLRR